MVAHTRITRTEVICISVLTLCGISLRWGDLGLVHVEHFDEGVYASDIWFGAENGDHYPFQHLYAPPLFPWLTEWSITAFGPTPLGCMFWSLLFGSATVPLVWWVGRRWFGPLAGMVTAVLSAASEFHAVYSRACLTDATLLFWLVAAVWLIWEALERNSWRWAVAGGVATGIAWWTKYNGWLPLAISLAGIAGCSMFARSNRQHFAGRLMLWGVTAVVALATWTPVWLGLQDVGGYAAVAENHSGYLAGVSGWVDSIIRHEAAHRVFENWGVKFEIAAWFGLLSLLLRFTWNAETAEGLPSANRAIVLWLAAGALCIVSTLASSTIALALCCVVVIAIGVVNCGRNSVEPSQSLSASLAFWFGAAWFIGLTVVTPLYFPYPRLTLPWLAGSWLVTGCALAQIADRASLPARLDRIALRSAAILTIVWGCLWYTEYAADQARLNVSNLSVCFSPRERGYGASRDDRRALDIGELILRECADDCGSNDFVVLVQGHPAVFFHLRDATPNVYAIATIEQAKRSSNSTVPVYLLTSTDSEPLGKRVRGYDRIQSQLVQSNELTMHEHSLRLVRLTLYRVDNTN